MTPQSVTVIGAGYVGLTTAVCLSHLGHEVTCVDRDVWKILELAQGCPTHHEDGMAELLDAELESGRLKFTTNARLAASSSTFVFLCLPTPGDEAGDPDLTALFEVASDIGPHLADGTRVVIKSTAPPGTSMLVDTLLDGEVEVVVNPEFLRAGDAIGDFLEPDRIVIGASSIDVGLEVASLYSRINAPLIITDCWSAAMIKYAANAYLAMRLSYVNAIAGLCETSGANVADVMRGIGSDRRIGFEHCQPGPGWGGSCFGKDTRALLAMAGGFGRRLELLEATLSSNAHRFDEIADRIVELAEGGIVGVWGLTYKAGTDDLRDSPALEILRRLEGRVTVQAYDPTVEELAGVEVCVTAERAADGASVLVVLTPWAELALVDLAEVADRMEHRRVLDTRGILDVMELDRLGFEQ